jgi:hypothetical protein
MYFDTSQYTAGVASPLWPQDVSHHHQWYGHHANVDDYWHGHGQQLSYGRQQYLNFADDYRDYNKVNQWSYNDYTTFQQALLDNRLASQASQLVGLAAEPEEVLVVNSVSSGAYASLCADAAVADLVAFDAEWAPDHTYGSDNPISVLQLAFPLSRRAYVLQLNRIGGRVPAEVQMMLVNPEVRKIGFAVDFNDRAKMARSGISLTLASVTDLQELCAAALGVAGQASLSLKNAALGLLGYRLDKDKRLSCSDWASKELTQEQVRYAALDAWVPLRLCYSLL